MSKFINRNYKGLSQKYWKYQTFCWYMHDVILSLFQDCMEDDKMNVSITLDNMTDAEEFEKSNDIIEWLYKNGYSSEANQVLGQRIFHGILADMMNFLYESLNTIEKGKITVSLALLRKPIRDNLLYLEWLLGNPEGFIKLVNDVDVDKYAIEKLSATQKLNIIREAIKQLDNNKEFFGFLNENVYYDLRYNRDAGNSLQRVWDKANHLVTTRKHNRSQEFNFVFLDEEIHVDFIDYYYRQVPHLLFYTYNIVLKLYERFIREIKKTTKIYNNYLIVFKFCDLLGTVKASEYFNNDLKALLNFICLDCKKIIPVKLKSEEFRGFRCGWGFHCPECQNEIITSRYVFLEDYGVKSNVTEKLREKFNDGMDSR